MGLYRHGMCDLRTQTALNVEEFSWDSIVMVCVTSVNRRQPMRRSSHGTLSSWGVHGTLLTGMGLVILIADAGAAISSRQPQQCCTPPEFTRKGQERLYNGTT